MKYPSVTSVYFTDEKSGVCVGYGGKILVYAEDKWSREESGSDQN